MCGRQQGIVNQIFGMPCKQCDKSENHKAPGNRREEEETYRDWKEAEAEAGNAHADQKGAGGGLQCARMQVTHTTINIREREGASVCVCVCMCGIWRGSCGCASLRFTASTNNCN